MNAVCRACRFLRLQKRYWSSTGKWKRRREDRRKLPFLPNWKNAAPQIYCELIHAEKNRTLLSEVPHRKFLDLAVVYYYQMRGNRVPDATILIHETHRELWGISAEELDARAWENTCGICRCAQTAL